MAYAPIYQIDFSAKNTGKTLALTKKCIKFKFGYANPHAIREGKSGVECRGEEHEIEMQWSLVSGRRNVFVDGREIHTSTLPRLADPKMPFQLKFHMKKSRDHLVHLVAYASPPTSSMVVRKFGADTPVPRQFELRFGTKGVDRTSFFDLPHIYQLEKGVPSVYALVKCAAPEKSEEILKSSISVIGATYGKRRSFAMGEDSELPSPSFAIDLLGPSQNEPCVDPVNQEQSPLPLNQRRSASMSMADSYNNIFGKLETESITMTPVRVSGTRPSCTTELSPTSTTIWDHPQIFESTLAPCQEPSTFAAPDPLSFEPQATQHTLQTQGSQESSWIFDQRSPVNNQNPDLTMTFAI